MTPFQSRITQTAIRTDTLHTVLWGIFALLIGLLVALLPEIVVTTGFILIIFSILILVAPQSALVLMLIFAPMRSLIETETVYPLLLDIGQLTVLLLIGRWIADRIIHKKRIILLNSSHIVIPILVFCVLSGFSIFTSTSLGSWLTEWLKWVIILVIAIIILNADKAQSWEWLVGLLIISGVAQALIGLYVFTGGSGADHLRISGQFFRALGTFGQPNPFGGFMGLLAPIAIMMAFAHGTHTFQYWHNHNGLSRGNSLLILFYTVSALLLSVGVLISWSRGAWLSYGVTLVVIGIASPRKWWQSLAVLFAGLACITAVWLTGILPASIEDRIQSATEDIIAITDSRGVDITTDNFAVIERLAHWQAATNMISDNLWLGVGFGNYEIAYDSYRLINWHEPLGHAHNYYLNVFAETGIIGGIGYVFMWISLFWFTWRSRQHPDNFARSFVVGLLGTWTYLTVHSMTDNLYVNNIFLHIGVMIGLLSIIYRQTWQTNRYHKK